MDTKKILPIYIIGDSHVLPYKHAMIGDRITDSWVMAHTHYIPGFKASDMWLGYKHGLHPGVCAALEYEGLVRKSKAVHLSRDAVDFNVAQATGRSLCVPHLMFAFGDIDVRANLLKLLTDQYDLIPPFEQPYKKSGSPIYPWDEFEKAMMLIIEAVISGLNHLKTAGFSRIYVQAIVPPTTNDKKFEEMLGFSCPLDVRYKTVVAFNRLIEEKCKPLNIHVINAWHLLTENGILRPEFEVDGVHIPPSAAALHLPMLVEHSINRTWFGTNYVRHELFYKICRDRILN